MDLLDKFDAVTILADARISQADKDYCETQQKAYEAAISSYKELAFFWEDMLRVQEELVGPRSGQFYTDYLESSQGPTISRYAIEKHIKKLHSIFISAVVDYFNSQYHVTVSGSDIKETLLPKEPDSYRCEDDEKLRTYHETMQNLIVKYQDIVDQIILRLDGRSFTEQAFYELRTACHNAAWNSYQKKPEFERKKATIRFAGYKCSCDSWAYSTYWELTEGMKRILRAAAHFETGGYHVYPLGFSDLINYSRRSNDFIEFPTCEKFQSLKMFKNGRVDLKFASESLAQEFIDTYIGMTL